MKSYNIAIVGATGLVGQTFLKVLDEYQISINELRLFASERSLGKNILFQNKKYIVDTIKPGSFNNIDYALFSAGASTSLKYASQAVSEGAIVIDNSSCFRMDKDVPLVVPEVNLYQAKKASLIANPNCSTIQSVLPLHPLHEKFQVLQVQYNTYQAVSGAGSNAITDLKNTRNGKDESHFPYNISETCIPQIDVFLEDGYTKEEHKMIDETRKILNDDSIEITATCVRVPIENSHAVSIRVKLKKETTVEEIKELLQNQKGIKVIDDIANNLYPVTMHSNGNDFVYVGRLREDLFSDNTFLLYTVSDNIRKGAASNAIQIMLGVES